MQVGRTVRIRRRNSAMTQRAVIATLDDASACVFPERVAAASSSWLGRATADEETEEEEITVLLASILPLLEFEEETQPNWTDRSIIHVDGMQQYKQWGDALYNIQDFGAAIFYYESALQRASISLGSTVFLAEEGHIRAAEVDCIEGNDDDDNDTCTTYDVTMVESGQEKTLPRKDILLCLLEPHADHLQERMLLNLSRCFLRYVEALDPAANQRSWIQRAVWATSLSLAIAATIWRGRKDDAAEDHAALTKYQISALLLRSQAQLLLQKYAHALADARSVLQARPNHQEATVWVQKIERQKKHTQKTNQRLAKHVSQWVQTALSETPVRSEENDIARPDGGGSGDGLLDPSPAAAVVKQRNSLIVVFWVFAGVVLIFAWLFQKQQALESPKY